MNYDMTLYGYTYTQSAGDDRLWVHDPDGSCLGYFKPDYTFVPITTPAESAAMLRDCLAKMGAKS